jgi:D-amino-acid dehydrogenase
MRVCVIGAGVVGLTTAYFLARAGQEVVLIDRNGKPAQEASYANGSQLSYSYVAPLAAPGALSGLFGALWREDGALKLRPRFDVSQWRWAARFIAACNRGRQRRTTSEMLPLAFFSRHAMHEIVAAERIDFDYGRRGKLIFYRDRDAFERAARLTEFQAALGTEQRVLDAADCVGLEPALAEMHGTLQGGIYTPSEEIGDCQKFCSGLDRVLDEKYAVRRLYHHQVGTFCREGRRIRSVLTDRGEIEADTFVLAGGLTSRDLARRLGFHLPLYPLKGYSLSLPQEGDAAGPSISVTDSHHRIVYAPLGRTIRIAAMVDVGSRHGGVEPLRVAALKAKIADCFPRLRGLEHAAAWAGRRPATAQGKPIFGTSPYSNLFLNVGHGALGFTLASGTARLVTDLVSGTKPPLSVEPFRLGAVH